MKEIKSIIIKALKNLKYYLISHWSFIKFTSKKRRANIKHNLLIYYIVKANKYWFKKKPKKKKKKKLKKFILLRNHISMKYEPKLTIS